MRCLIWVCFITSILISYKATADTKLQIYTEQFPPYNYSQNDMISGLNIDIIKEACRHAQIHCDFELYPWKRSFKKAQSTPNGGLISTSRTPSREKLFKWIGPIVSSPSCFYKLKSRTDINVTERQDILNYTVGLPWTDIYEQVLQKWGYKKGVNYIAFSEKYAYSNAFKSQKLDLFIASSNTLHEHLIKLNLSIDEVEPVYLLSDPILGGNYLALNTKVDDAIADKLQLETSKLMNSDTLTRLKRKYIKTTKLADQQASKLAKQCEI